MNKETPNPQLRQTAVMRCFFIRIWLNYQIKFLEKSIRNVELNIYFDRWTGQDCIEHNNYSYQKINELKLKLKKYE